MDTILLLGEYFVWHYGKSLRDFLAFWGNLLWFEFHFFSIRLLVGTLFAPYKRFHQQYDWTHLELATLGQDILLNLFMRLLGMVLRLAVLAAGIVLEIVLLATGVICFVLWLLIPVIIPFLALSGLYLILG